MNPFRCSLGLHFGFWALLIFVPAVWAIVETAGVDGIVTLAQTLWNQGITGSLP